MGSKKDKDENRKGTLILESVPEGYSTYKVIACDYDLTRDMNGGKPAGAAYLMNNCIRVTVETRETAKFLRSWALSDEIYSGTISMVISAGKAGARDRTMRYIHFSSARIKTIHEYFNDQNSQMMTTVLEISPLVVSFVDEGRQTKTLSLINGSTNDLPVQVNSEKIVLVMGI